jgi:hypothetical protein
MRTARPLVGSPERTRKEVRMSRSHLGARGNSPFTTLLVAIASIASTACTPPGSTANSNALPRDAQTAVIDIHEGINSTANTSQYQPVAQGKPGVVVRPATRPVVPQGKPLPVEARVPEGNWLECSVQQALFEQREAATRKIQELRGKACWRPGIDMMPEDGESITCEDLQSRIAEQQRIIAAVDQQIEGLNYWCRS